MAINHYESVVIINAALEDPQIEEAVKAVKDYITAAGGEITDVENWGRKRLAYAINNAKSGYYLITRFTAPTSLIKEFERTLRLDENVIRYMTITLDKKALEYINKMKSARSEKEVKPEIKTEDNNE